jgi:lycopene cyclase domain-containing protein
MYLVILVAFFASALWLEGKYHVHLYRTRTERILITLVFFVVGVIWDSWATIHQTWIYPGPGLVGIWIGVLPLEEYLFSLIVPFWILTVYTVLDQKLNIARSNRERKETQP